MGAEKRCPANSSSRPLASFAPPLPLLGNTTKGSAGRAEARRLMLPSAGGEQGAVQHHRELRGERTVRILSRRGVPHVEL
eukprot:3600283-Pyramimonas_sp.AAC.2